MKKLSIIAMLLILVACSKKETPAPVTPAWNTTASLTCMQSTWKYEVILGTPAMAGMFEIQYRDPFNNLLSDTTITSSWTKEIEFQLEASPGVVIAHLTFLASITGALSSQTVPLTNTVMVTIYRNGQVVETTGIFIDYCLDGNGGCPSTSVAGITKNHICTN